MTVVGQNKFTLGGQTKLRSHRDGSGRIVLCVSVTAAGGDGERTTYETDLVAWASDQARLIRAGRFGVLDREHIAAKIHDVVHGEQRELASRMAMLLARLLT